MRDLGDWIARDNPRRARSFVRELREHCGRVARPPRLYPVRQEFGSDVRLAIHANYLILFSERGDGTVVIERVVHGMRHFAG